MGREKQENMQGVPMNLDKIKKKLNHTVPFNAQAFLGRKSHSEYQNFCQKNLSLLRLGFEPLISKIGVVDTKDLLKFYVDICIDRNIFLKVQKN